MRMNINQEQDNCECDFLTEDQLSEETEYTVNKEQASMRIDKYLASLFPDMSRSFLQKKLKEEEIFVNDSLVKPNYKVVFGDKIKLQLSAPKEILIEAEEMPLDIIYEDLDLLLVNKPKGMVVHPAPGHYSGTLVNGIMAHCKEELSGINGVLRPGIVHRIDRDTTGLLFVCKNDMAHNEIAAQLATHSVERKYRAIVHGVIQDDQGTVSGPIGRHPIDRKKMAINEKNGKPAVTHYKVLQRFQNFTYIECQLETGRTHQIRVHMASIHHPLLGDVVYGPQKPPYKTEGQTLHAMTLGFVHPRTKEYMRFEAPLPEYFQRLLRILPS